jgi:hypothetical protein
MALGSLMGAAACGSEEPAVAPPAKYKAVTELACPAQVSEGASHRLVSTTGQPSQNQGLMTSSRFQLRGGFIGATGRQP